VLDIESDDVDQISIGRRPRNCATGKDTRKHIYVKQVGGKYVVLIDESGEEQVYVIPEKHAQRVIGDDVIRRINTMAIEGETTVEVDERYDDVTQRAVAEAIEFVNVSVKLA
jgi:hypothetical protein